MIKAELMADQEPGQNEDTGPEVYYAKQTVLVRFPTEPLPPSSSYSAHPLTSKLPPALL